jgi:hypothetical protein
MPLYQFPSPFSPLAARTFQVHQGRISNCTVSRAGRVVGLEGGGLQGAGTRARDPAFRVPL